VLLVTCVAALGWGAIDLTAQQRGAADPIIGTWKLNLAQSKFPPGMPGVPRSQTEIYREASPGQLEMVLSRVQDDGATIELTLLWPMAGGAVQLLKGTRPPGETLVETRLGPGDWLVTYMMNGEQYGTLRKTISRDGTTMRQTFTGIVAGKPLELTFVVERQ